MTPKTKYEKDLDEYNFHVDSAQRNAVMELDKLYRDYNAYMSTSVPKLSKWQQLLGRSQQRPALPKGIYMWGGVGRGKTYLMDTFCESLTGNRVMRVHFHRFMLRVHEELKSIGEVSDPLEAVADVFTAETDIICFDEFFVSDITDAMILGTLFQGLFNRGIVLVATSNIPPNDLYRNGLQRARFLPAIELIEQHCQIINVDGGVDYRLRTLEQAEIYHYPLDDVAKTNLDSYYAQLTSECKNVLNAIEINHRDIAINKACDGVLYASFSQLCQTARSQNDYIEISRLYHSVLLSGVMAMDATSDDAARRFIALVDEFYERNVKLIISAEVMVEALYKGGRLEFEFKRCLSRLIEMQSHDYLAKEHLT